MRDAENIVEYRYWDSNAFLGWLAEESDIIKSTIVAPSSKRPRREE